MTARVHPGETNSSYMMQGAIDFLLGDSREARILRKNFVFKIVPMLNPDGVIYGNYRCSLLGVDLNRRWQSPNKHLHPTIFYSKRLFQAFSESHSVSLYCDLHGHSMKKNVFMYACGLRGNDPDSLRTNLLAKLIPLCLSTRNRIFSLRDTKFRLEKSKEGTARIVMFKELHIVNSYTLEASFYGPSHVAALDNRDPEPGERNGDSHMNEEHLEGLGRDLCRAILYFVSPAVLRKRLEEAGKLLRDLRPGAPTFSHRAGNKPAPPPVAEESKETEETQALERVQGAFEMSEGLLDELQEYDQAEGSGDFMADVMQAIEGNPELAALAQADEDSDSGGSDALGSDNDDQKGRVTVKPVEVKSAQPRRPKPSPKRKLRFAQRSDSAMRSRPGPLKPLRSKPSSVPPKPPSKPSYLFQTIQQNLEALYACKRYAVKPATLQKGDSSQSFTEAESCFSQAAGEFRDVSLDPEPKLARGGAYPHYGAPPRPASGFSPGSSFIITSIHQPSQLSVLNPKLNGRKLPARPLPMPKSGRRNYISANESARTESSPVPLPAPRDQLSRSALDHLR